MNKVNILPPDVIAKIAAGEAVDRPAAVVKELLENSIDAQASSIEIHLKDAGRELIHLKDNGSGILPADLEKIFHRHATSKISAIEDLEALHSMGFRGEALYSIAAVSDVVLTTRTKTQEGWQVHLRGGVRQNLEPASLNHIGTDIKIAELFYNTPARRKFLKSNASELHQILNVVMPYTLIYPQTRFLLTHAGRSLLDLKPAPARLDRVAAALNISMNHFIEAREEFHGEEIQVQMTLGTINVQRPRRDLQFIFINRRPVESKSLSFNLNDIYRLILPPGVYGAFIVDITLNSAHVDVNIHPTKREVRIKDEARLISLLRRMAESHLMRHGQARTIGLESETAGGIAASQLIFARQQFEDRSSVAPSTTMFPLDKKDGALPLDFQLFGHDTTLRSQFATARYIGAFIQKYLMFEASRSLLLVDQHAAQERIMFEKFKNQLEASQVEIQPLLTPIMLQLTPQEKIAWEERKEELTAAGIETTQFDEDTIAIQAQPLLLKNLETVVRSLLAGDAFKRMDRETLARRACKASVVSGDRLDASQADHQRRELLACQDPFTCPHGRPTLIEVTQDFIDRQFLRT